MMKNFFIPALLVLFLAGSCKKEDPKEPEVPVTPQTPTGNIHGRVTHYGQFGTTYTTGLNNTTVSIEGQNFTTITDATGDYTISGVKSNTYTLVFAKPGCGIIKKQDIVYTAGDTASYNAGVADLPTFTLINAYIKDTLWFSNTLAGIYCNASVSPANNEARVVAIFGKSPNITLADPLSYLNYATASPLNIPDFYRFFSYPLLKDTYGFKKDSVLYLKIYPISSKGASYFNNKLNTLVYTAYGNAYPGTFTIAVK